MATTKDGTGSAPQLDPERVPVVVASGQSIRRPDSGDKPVTPVDLMARACEAVLGDAPGLRHRIQRLSVVNIMTRTSPAPATELAGRLGIAPRVTEVTTLGGNSPQWLVNRAASDIADGRLAVTLIAGAEAICSSRERREAGVARPDDATVTAPDPVVGDDRPGVGPAESAIGLLAPVQVYPLFESVVAARAGLRSDQHRHRLGELLAPFTRVAAAHPFAWFRQALTARSIATPSPSNRIVAEPYTKRMTAFLGSDQGAALMVCSLAEARRAGVAERAVFVWAGAEATDVRFVTARGDPGRSPAIAAAGRALFAAASAGTGSPAARAPGRGGKPFGIDDVGVIELYSCFPSAVELGAAALGIALDDRRGLTVTGGLPYFGGPGNNYTTHGIATLTDVVRERGGLGLATGLGWFVTKHALGLYGSDPPPSGFRRGDTAADQAIIHASAVDVALAVPEETWASVVAATVVRDRDGSPTGAPLIVRLPDGRHAAAEPVAAETTAEVGRRDVPSLVGTTVVVGGDPPRYRLPEE